MQSHSIIQEKQRFNASLKRMKQTKESILQPESTPDETYNLKNMISLVDQQLGKHVHHLTKPFN